MVAAGLQPRPRSVDHRRVGDREHAPDEPVDAGRLGGELGLAQVERVPRPVGCAPQDGVRVALERLAVVREQELAERLTRLPRPPELRAGVGDVLLGEELAEPVPVVLEVDGVDEELHEPQWLGSGLREVVAGHATSVVRSPVSCSAAKGAL